PSSETTCPVGGKKRPAGAWAWTSAGTSASHRATKRSGPFLTDRSTPEYLPRRPLRPSAGLAEVRRDRLHELGLRHVADDPLDRLAVLEDDQGRDAHHAELLGNLRVLVDVDLGD